MCGIVIDCRAGCGEGARLAALESLRHRGPDNQGTWEDPVNRVWLGHRRLSIVDVSAAGNQPMSNEDGSIQMVGNGEIYNAPALRTRLEALGHRLRSRNNDNEIIPHAYEAWGEGCVDYLEGMFAFGLWDRKRRCFFAARDRLGIKPLYYLPHQGGLVLASEAEALRRIVAPRSLDCDPLALAHTLTLGYVPAPLSIWKELKKLEPGHWLRQDENGDIEIRRYWEPPREIDAGGDRASPGFAERFETVLQEHLLADVEIGLFLSGGIDSSAVAAGLAALKQPLQAFTVGFPSSPRSEARQAAVTAAHLGLPHTVVEVTGESVPDLFDRAARVDEPQTGSGLLPMLSLCAATAGRFKVALSGDGGDEIFAGYTWYRNLEAPLAPPWWRRLMALVPHPHLYAQRADLFAKASIWHRHAWRLFPRFLPEEVSRLLAPMGLRFTDEEMLAPLQRHVAEQLPLSRQLQRVDLMSFCADHVLPKVDRASMAHGVEVRVPFLDHRLVEWALSRPPDPRELNGPGKPWLHDYLADKVPPEVLTRPKQGFSLRVEESTPLSERLADLAESPWVKQGLWHADWKKMACQPGPHQAARLWILSMLDRWGRYHL
ncbi:MAG: asparagine synthase (glutamine-hydrolyzing) [Magnetococcales bacterium]|nr:asparagine synthase (glutamine-hydrolyzing) [Magnetococcales bacterium]